MLELLLELRVRVLLNDLPDLLAARVPRVLVRIPNRRVRPDPRHDVMRHHRSGKGDNLQQKKVIPALLLLCCDARGPGVLCVRLRSLLRLRLRFYVGSVCVFQSLLVFVSPRRCSLLLF